MTDASSLADMWKREAEGRATNELALHGVAHAAREIHSVDDVHEREYSYEWEEDWETWLAKMFPSCFRGAFAPHQAEFWAWVWRVELKRSQEPFVGVWARGGGKSTSAEVATVALGVRGRRRYGIYMRSTQLTADTSVANIAALLESENVERYYPQHGQRAVSKYGSPKGWRRNRLRTAGGLTVDALGFDTAARGVKVDEQRPDFIVFDDIDETHDSPYATKKKIERLTKAILPTGSTDVVVLGIQNLIIPHGIFSQLIDGRADFLVKRRVSGPHPAIKGMKTEMVEEDGRMMARITEGNPTWKGQGLAECQDLMDLIGLSSFNQECQHQVHEREGAIWSRDMIKRVDKLPQLKRAAVAVDPSGGGDEIGIIGAGIGFDDRGYVFADRTQEGKLGPLNWANATIDVYDEWELDMIIGERNYGGDMVEGNIKAAVGKRRVPFEYVNASRGKTLRAEPVGTLYADGEVSHVGTFPELETEMTSWVQGDPWSPNRLDALVHCLTWLLLGKRKKGMRWGSQGVKSEG